MWKSSEFCDFNLSWQSDHDPNFLSTYTVIQNDDDWDGTEEIADEANSSFITCNRCEHSCSLEISCECKPHHGVSIVGLIVRSQARTLELYSNSDGYLQTARGKKVHEDGIFCCTSKLETPFLQFVGLGERTSVKIYKLHFILEQNCDSKTSSKGSTGMIDISKVKGYLHSMGDSAPEGGTKLLHAVEDYQQTQMSKLGALSSALSVEGADTSSMLSNLLSMVTKSHDTKTSSDKTPTSQLRNDQEIKQQGMKNSSPLTAMLMSMSRSQDVGQGESEGQGGMFAMLQNICGKVGQMRVAEHAAETGAETLQDDQTDVTDTRSKSHPDVGASNDDTLSQNLTGSHIEMLQATIQQTVSQMVQSSEEKILKYVDTRLNTMETKLNQKLDTIIQLLQKKDNMVKDSSLDT
ncbi:uncharacterized protein LOC132756568 [Ruditapes philippinarum]|uniref:uncharacterized protein LOC132756568 n=1 Tax=Ruditapes philippinarum TaxID=129788 RepID=UPI00295C2874|nr:uncharacterized protein LOC132756568 [Ruditapes philippinarum]